MAEIIFPQNMEAAEDPAALSDALIRLQKNLSWMLEHLDSTNIKSINTSQTTVKSEDGATVLDGAQIVMRDENDLVRAVLGKEADGTFVFRLYDADGNAAVQMDEDGHAVFSGKIKGADIEGSNIRIAPNIFEDYIALENDGANDRLGLYYGGTCIGGIQMLDGGGMEIFGKKIYIGSATGNVTLGPGATGIFTTADGKTVTVIGGVITGIV